MLRERQNLKQNTASSNLHERSADPIRTAAEAACGTAYRQGQSLWRGSAEVMTNFVDTGILANTEKSENGHLPDGHKKASPDHENQRTTEK